MECADTVRSADKCPVRGRIVCGVQHCSLYLTTTVHNHDENSAKIHDKNIRDTVMNYLSSGQGDIKSYLESTGIVVDAATLKRARSIVCMYCDSVLQVDSI